MAIEWTKSQQRAIDERGEDNAVLVSAAAGSGKTAVLVERIIRTILDDKKSIDRLLVVTFTEAAAAQMRDKIIRELYKRLKDTTDGDEKNRIKEQIRLSGSADIMTIDSFCLRVLRNNFYILGVDANFRICDTAEGELMAEDAMNSLFDRLYCADANSKESQMFNHLLNIYATNSNDNGLKGLIGYIHRFIQSFAKPLEWLREKADMYCEHMEDSVWVNEYLVKMYINEPAINFYNIFGKLIQDAADKVLPAYDGSVLSEEEKLTLQGYYGGMILPLFELWDASKKLMRVKKWNSAVKIFKSIIPYKNDEYTARKKPENEECDIEVWKNCCTRRNALRDGFFDSFSVLGKTDDELKVLFYENSLKILVDELVWLTEEFDKEFTHKKDLRNVKEFSDIEHHVFKLFSENEDIREFYKEKYDDILIDEYQDTNGLQDSIFESISRDKKNLFMVGDLKQSIYRFRGGDPTIFKGKSKEFGRRDNDNIRIKLSENFRSRQEILGGVNEVFEKIMSDSLGDVDYDDTEKIVRKSDKDVWEKEYVCESHFIAVESEEDEEEEATTFMREAEFVAKKIKEMIKSGFEVKDGEKVRSLRAGDVTILARSVKGEVGDCLMSALEKEGINSYVEIEDFFSKREIQLMLSLLSVIDNNLQDIPLSAVMRSPIGGFSDNDMARIRIYSPNAGLMNAVRNYRMDEEGITNEEIALKIKCRNFVANISSWRNCVKRKSVANLIWTIYEETGFYDFMGAMDGGEESQANLRLLYERAKKYEQSGSKGLFNFIKYIEKIRSRRTDLSSANLTGNNNLVRIMTIHKSKGLEFPVVFLVGAKKRFNRRCDFPNVLLHNELGFGLKYADEENGYFKDTLFSDMVKKQNNREDMSEDMRLLYVALTRAKDKLFVVASEKFKESKTKTYQDKLEERLDKWRAGIDADEATCYADWIFPMANGFSNYWDFDFHEVRVSDELEDTEEELEEEKTEVSVSSELYEAVKRSFEFEYSKPLSGTIPAKTSVTALKQKNNEADLENADRKYEDDPVYMVEMPEFLRDKKLGTEIGTAHHEVMAYINLEEMTLCNDTQYEDFIEKEILRISHEGQVDKYYAENEKMRNTIVSHIAGFFRSRIGKEILKSDEVYREQPFQVAIGADEYDTSLNKSYNDEKVILQGVIDCFYKTERGIVLIDYKTDYCKSEKEVMKITEKYSVQLNLYADAIEKITGTTVAEKYLYLFAIGEERKIN